MLVQDRCIFRGAVSIPDIQTFLQLKKLVEELVERVQREKLFKENLFRTKNWTVEVISTIRLLTFFSR